MISLSAAINDINRRKWGIDVTFMDRKGLWTTPEPVSSFSDTTLDTGAHIADAVGTRVNKAAGDVWRYGDEGVANGGFETGDLAGWTVEGTAVASVVTDGSRKVLSLSAAGGGNNLSQSVSFAANKTIEFAFDRRGVKTGSSDLVGRIQLKYSDGTYGDTLPATNVVVRSDYETVRVRATLPKDVVALRLIATAQSADTDGIVYFDNISVREVKLPERLGVENVPDTAFASWTDSSVPDDWTKSGTHNAANYVQQSADGSGLRLVSDGTDVGVSLAGTYSNPLQITYEYSAKTSGSLRIDHGTSTYLTAEAGVRTTVRVSATTALTLKRSGGVTDCELSYLSVREVLPGELVGSELAAPTTAEGFTEQTGTLANVGGELELTATVAGVNFAQFNKTLEIGKTYHVECGYYTPHGQNCYIGGYINNSTIYHGTYSGSTKKRHHFVFTATHTSHTFRIRFDAGAIGEKAYFDQFSVREIRCPELVINGGFDADTDWTDGEVGLLQPDATITGGVLNLPRTDASNYCYSYQAISNIDVGAWFELVVEAGDNSTQVRIGGSALNASAGSVNAAANTTQRLIFQSTTSPQYVTLLPMTDSATSTVKSITVRPLGTFPSQSTTASKPTLAREPEGGRRNLLTWTEDFGNAAWDKLSAGTATAPVITENAATAPDGTNTATRLEASTTGTTSSDYSLIQQLSSLASGNTGTLAVWMKSNTNANQTVYFRSLNTDAVTTVVVTPEWQQVELTRTSTTETFYCTVGVRGSATGAASIDILLWHPQLGKGSTTTDYQRVRSQYDVYEAGKRHRYYDSFDGGDRLELPADIVDVAGSTTLIVPVRRSTTPNYETVFGATGNAGFGLLLNDGKVRPYVKNTDGTTVTAIVQTGPTITPLNEWFIVSVVYDRVNLRLRAWLNGAEEVDLTTLDQNLTAPSDFYAIGAPGSTTGVYLTGDAADLILRPFAMGDATRKRVERALAAEYGVTIA